MTNRRDFIRTGLAAGLLSVMPEVLRLSEPARWVRLPGPDGDFDVQLPRSAGFRAEAQAHPYQYHRLQQAQYYAALYNRQRIQMWAQQQAIPWVARA